MHHGAVTAGFARFGGLALTIALHASVVAFLLQMEPVRSAITQAAPIMVHLVSPPKVEKADVAPKPLPVEPRVEQRKPKPERKPRAERPKPSSTPKPPVMAATTETPSSFSAPPPPAPRVEPEAVPPPEPAPPKAPQSAPPARTATAALPITPPSFNAEYLQNPPPEYPTLSRRMGEEGKVVLRVLVSEAGVPEEVQLKSSSGFSRLDSVALEAVKHWKFVPARRGDQSVAAWVVVPISFSLRS